MTKVIFPPFGYKFDGHPDGLPATEDNISQLLEDMGIPEEHKEKPLNEKLEMLQSNGFEIE